MLGLLSNCQRENTIFKRNTLEIIDESAHSLKEAELKLISDFITEAASCGKMVFYCKYDLHSS